MEVFLSDKVKGVEDIFIFDGLKYKIASILRNRKFQIFEYFSGSFGRGSLSVGERTELLGVPVEIFFNELVGENIIESWEILGNFKSSGFLEVTRCKHNERVNHFFLKGYMIDKYNENREIYRRFNVFKMSGVYLKWKKACFLLNEESVAEWIRDESFLKFLLKSVIALNRKISENNYTGRAFIRDRWYS